MRSTRRPRAPQSRSSRAVGYRQYLLPALATQAGLSLFASGVHLEAKVLADKRTAQPANIIPQVKTEIVKEFQRPSFWRRLKRYLEDMLEDYVIHPVLTIWRFGVLAVIFLPLILTAPAVFIRKRQKDLHDERSGTIWWYSLLVRHMEMAGPTFIKVRWPRSEGGPVHKGRGARRGIHTVRPSIDLGALNNNFFFCVCLSNDHF